MFMVIIKKYNFISYQICIFIIYSCDYIKFNFEKIKNSKNYFNYIIMVLTTYILN